MNTALNLAEFQTLEELQNTPSQPEGMVAYVNDIQKYYIFLNGEWTETTGQVTSQGLELNLYEINQQIISQFEDFDESHMQDFKESLTIWFDERTNFNSFLMYGLEISYFTLFLKDKDSDENIVDLMLECLENIGPIKDFEANDNSFEIWVNYKDLTTCLYLFPYDEGVVKYHG